MGYDLTYERADSDSKGPQPGTVALRDYVRGRWPETRDLGIYVYRPIRGSTSLSIHSEGRAWDCGLPVTPAGKAIGDEIAAWVIDHAAQLGIQYMIWYRRSWRQSRGWRPYGGTNPHVDHLHLEQTRLAAAQLTADDIFAMTPPSIPLGPVTTTGKVWTPPLNLRPWRSALGVKGGSVILADNGDIYCPTTKYYGSPNDEILGRDFDVLGEPDYLLAHPTVPDGYVVVTDLRYSYAYPDE